MSLIRNVMLVTLVVVPFATAQEKDKSPCAVAPAPASTTAKQARDLSDAALQGCQKAGDCHWDAAKGCLCVIVVDGDGSNVLRIDTQSSAVQKNTADYEYERLPVERSIGGILSLP